MSARRWSTLPQQAQANADALGTYMASARPPVCPRCSNGLPTCTDLKPGGLSFLHSETCAVYEWADDLCDRCYADPALKLETSA